MGRRIIVLTPRGRRSISVYTERELEKVGEEHLMNAGQTTITTEFQLTENDTLYRNGSLQGLIKDLPEYSITDSCVLTTSIPFGGGEQIHIIPWQ